VGCDLFSSGERSVLGGKGNDSRDSCGFSGGADSADVSRNGWDACSFSSRFGVGMGSEETESSPPFIEIFSSANALSASKCSSSPVSI